ncbi:YDG/SRA domain-containing protein [Peterkaempfera sp. SMS 1(5)a]|uniref:YDG/SRA domain-containing protein n=1 Tax=Peterkaempfera podocarpi TaxID=3232308 RepID=UPI00367043A2
MAFVDEVCAEINALRVDQSSGQPARHQPITLLWAIGRAAGGQPRLVPWSDARPALRRLLKDHGRPGSDPAPEYPFVALSRSRLWELDGAAGEVPVARGSGVRRWLDEHSPRGGLEGRLYELMATNLVARRRVVDTLLHRFFDGAEPTLLLGAVHLAAPIFDGFGLVPGIAVGQVFPNRRALFDARVHRQLQAGICGTQERGAESIVVSGGYEDDEDHGDVIIYTGQGGRDERTGQQVKDQELTLGNAALVTSLTTGTPIRVVRGANGEPAHSPVSGLRYDGLFRVEDYWCDHGQAGHLVWRYRLVQIADTQLPDQPLRAMLPVPEGEETPSRLEATIRRIVRSTAVADYVKRIHDFTCQVCGIRLATPTGAYAEAAHIRALGRPHSGPDVAANVLCLCPNHHTLFDFGMLSIADDRSITDESTGVSLGPLREKPAHQIDPAHLAYHRAHHAQLRRDN